jgi:predicted alpha/beta-fold hydrolase
MLKSNLFSQIKRQILPKLSSQVERWSGAEIPTLYYSKLGAFQQIEHELPQLTVPYRPTPWLSNTHAHLLYFDMIRKNNVQLEYDQIEQLTMQDGGVTAIAWYGKHLPADTPTIVMMHTITGSPDSMRELVKDLHRYTGWRVALCVRRGHGNLPMPVGKFCLFGSPEDLCEQIAHIQTSYPQSTLYGVGSSAGTSLLVRYLGEEGEQSPLRAAFALCPGYDLETGFDHLHRFYSRYMAKKVLKTFVHPHVSVWQSKAGFKQLIAQKELSQLHRSYFEFAGYTSYADYDQAINPIHVFEQIKVPLMILNAEDDPVCNIRNFDPYKDRVRELDHVMVVTTKKGSHCGFYEGMRNPEAWSTKLMADFLKLQHARILKEEKTSKVKAS